MVAPTISEPAESTLIHVTAGNPTLIGISIWVIAVVFTSSLHRVFVPVVNEGIFPFPLLPNPIVVLSLYQLNVPPDGVVENVGIFANVLGQNTSLLKAVSVGFGFTVMLNDIGVDGQPLLEAVTETVPVILLVLLLVPAVKLPILPTPFEVNPINVFEFVQLNVDPKGFVLNAGILVGSPGQTEMSDC